MTVYVEEFKNIGELKTYMDKSRRIFIEVIPVPKQFTDNGKSISTINYVLIEKTL